MIFTALNIIFFQPGAIYATLHTAILAKQDQLLKIKTTDYGFAYIIDI